MLECEHWLGEGVAAISRLCILTVRDAFRCCCFVVCFFVVVRGVCDGGCDVCGCDVGVSQGWTE